jgi:hypothetical protein
LGREAAGPCLRADHHDFGGIVQGDRYTIEIDLGPHAQAHVTALALDRDLGPILLGGPERLSWRVGLRRLSAWPSTGWLTRRPVRSAKRAA